MIDEVLEDSLLLEVDEISLVLAKALDSLELYSLLLLKAGLEQAVSVISAMIGNSFFMTDYLNKTANVEPNVETVNVLPSIAKVAFVLLTFVKPKATQASVIAKR